MKTSDMKNEAYLFSEILKDFIERIAVIWRTKAKLAAEDAEDAQYAQALFRDEIKKYLRKDPFDMKINKYIKELAEKDKEMKWDKDKEKFLDLAETYFRYLGQYKKEKLGGKK